MENKKTNIHSIITELDSILSKNDYSRACDFLKENLAKAESRNEGKVLFTLFNECIGIYRKLGDRENCLLYCEKSLNSVRDLKLENTVAGATAFINCGTALKAFGEAQKSIALFEKALAVYESSIPPNDNRLAGLYNNYGLSLTDLKKYEKAELFYNKAVSVLEKNPIFKPELAVTYLNMANLSEAQKGLLDSCDEIESFLSKAETLLNESFSETDGNYAFVCEKCAPTFGYYGWFRYEKELSERARRIYERS